MARGGYPAAATGSGLRAAFPAITPTEMALALAQAYPPAQTPEQLAQSCLAQQVDGAGCGQRLVQTFPTLTFGPLATAMAQGGYPAAATGSGLKAAFPTITPLQMAEALAQAYPKA